MFNDIIKAINIEPYYRDNNVAIFNGDCRDILPLLSGIDAIVTDPPYELGFMGKSWDSTGIAYDLKVWQGCINALKNGGHLLAFGGTRTYHRMACAIEDAGFEIRDMIEWVYGSGFPKSLNIGKNLDKYIKTGNASWNGTGDSSKGALGYSKLQHQQGYRPNDYSNKHQNKNEITEERAKQWEGWGTALKPAHEPVCLARKPIKGTVAGNVLEYGTGGINIDGCRVGTTGARNNGNSKGTVGSNSIGVYGKAIKQDYNTGRFPANLIHDGSDEVLEIFPDSNGSGKARRLSRSAKPEQQGWGMNKNEPDEVFLNDAGSGSAARFFYQAQWTPEELNILEANTNNELKQKWIEIAKLYNDIDLTPIEAFIASMLNDDLSGCSMKYCAKASKSEKDAGCEELVTKQTIGGGGMNNTEDDVCGKYGSIKAPGKNNHPTVKPLALMEYLIKLITPPKGIVLDPFMGSGSTLVAARKLGYKAIGIELNKDYAEIAVKRLAQGVLI